MKFEFQIKVFYLKGIAIMVVVRSLLILKLHCITNKLREISGIWWDRLTRRPAKYQCKLEITFENSKVQIDINYYRHATCVFTTHWVFQHSYKVPVCPCLFQTKLMHVTRLYTQIFAHFQLLTDILKKLGYKTELL